MKHEEKVKILEKQKVLAAKLDKAIEEAKWKAIHEVFSNYTIKDLQCMLANSSYKLNELESLIYHIILDKKEELRISYDDKLEYSIHLLRGER